MTSAAHWLSWPSVPIGKYPLENRLLEVVISNLPQAESNLEYEDDGHRSPSGAELGAENRPEPGVFFVSRLRPI